MSDHNPAPLQQLLDLCSRIQRFLDADPMNVVCVHCLGGQGRSGTVTASFLLFTQSFRTAHEALEYVSSRRFERRPPRSPGGPAKQVVRHPSQIRYVQYVSLLAARETDSDGPVPSPPRLLAKIRIYGISRLGRHWRFMTVPFFPAPRTLPVSPPVMPPALLSRGAVLLLLKSSKTTAPTCFYTFSIIFPFLSFLAFSLYTYMPQGIVLPDLSGREGARLRPLRALPHPR